MELALDPLIIGEVMGHTATLRMYVTAAFCILASVIAFFKGLSLREDERIVLGTIVIIVSIICMALSTFPVRSIIENQPRDERAVDHDVLAELITERYVIDSARPADPLSEDAPHEQTSAEVSALCAPVSTESPEMVGITDGQQITFKVGVADCSAEEPVAEIIVTETPGQAITAEDLEHSPAA